MTNLQLEPRLPRSSQPLFALFGGNIVRSLCVFIFLFVVFALDVCCDFVLLVLVPFCVLWAPVDFTFLLCAFLSEVASHCLLLLALSASTRALRLRFLVISSG